MMERKGIIGFKKQTNKKGRREQIKNNSILYVFYLNGKISKNEHV